MITRYTSGAGLEFPLFGPVGSAFFLSFHESLTGKIPRNTSTGSGRRRPFPIPRSAEDTSLRIRGIGLLFVVS